MSSLPASSRSEWGSLRPGVSARASSRRTRPSAVAISQGPGSDVAPALIVSRYRDGASLTALAALTLCDREGVSLSGLPLDVIGDGELGSGIVLRRRVSELHGPSPSRPSCG